MFPDPADTFVLYAHAAYLLRERFALTGIDIPGRQVRDSAALADGIAEAHVLVATGLWNNALIERAAKLRYIQVCGVGYDNFDIEALRAKGIMLCNSRAVNANAVSEHAMALTLGLMRQLHTGRDHQRAHHWRGMISDLSAREDELPGKTVLVFGAGTIGGRIARLSRAFDAKVIGIKRNLNEADPAFDEVHPTSAFASMVPRADVVILSCPLTDETRHIVNAEVLGAMKPSAYLINVARGGCVDEAALIEALRSGAIAGAGIDVTATEPLGQDSPLWDFDNVILTPHTGGETRAYEDRVAAVLKENLERLWRGESALLNQIV